MWKFAQPRYAAPEYWMLDLIAAKIAESLKKAVGSQLC